MNNAPVLFERDGHVARITLNRPAVLNALDLATHAALAEIWDAFEADDTLWVAVLSGSGERAFSAGQDLKELAARLADGVPSSSFGSQGSAGWPRLTERFDLCKPVIARVNGLALGGGFELALACDIIVACDTAEFALPEARLGLIPGAGGVFRLTRQLPYRSAMGYLLSGRRIGAARALALGLVNEVVPAAQLDTCVDGWLADLLACAPLSLRAIKQAAAMSASLPLADAFAARYPWEERRRHSQDSREGPLAFVEKRAPHWCGQ
ncbi:enoyl-CoA hydratase-related protein [Xanthomonas prunicola]|uniref:Enoyl-CoA hydratase-related protein n=1 Tax=Xanthomonas prunicola TaxID=2053930 RepID=A0A9Q9IYJ2_9XANT|nr:enoyl-CoA-hydratase DpgD [Xanthomonas prunicola]USJ00456.1 enoyl-CoA hydratase-related protein [Xanthomonas prunicola]UXA49010.1 enoyl-CoA hydratase-related protein [Xanthomonas prunicola]UXA53242.1 enoyl-CoA hydratase-related protein [Xanthomonas prunicola]UXA57312.1 enoyl-CoA hydratase-related protein [Xanthomonas prunicola]UXA63266.1 enoyl-CoA hydratase-related protein [Xanthomonas prunicola]